jgi:hypothetical protein
MVAAAMVPVYFCPLVGGPRQNTAYNQGSPAGTTIRGLADYTANAGSWGYLGNAAPGSNSYDGPVVGSQFGSQGIGNGNASGIRRIMAHITDGTSNTLLIGEKFQTAAGLVANGNSCNNDQGYVDGWDNDMIVFSQGATNGAVPTGATAITATTPPTKGLSFTPQAWNLSTSGSNCGGFFGSIHPQGMPALFCDGTVRNIPFGINQATFFSLCSINDGAAVTLPD